MTIDSGAGSGFFEPCVLLSTDIETNASISFGSYSVTSQPLVDHGNCGSFGAGQLTVPLFPFVDGVTQTFVISLTDYSLALGGTAANNTGGLASLSTPLFFDANGDPLNNVSFTMSSTPVTLPEPSGGLLVGVALAALAFARRSGK
jgi:hypothetical protein